MKLSRTDLRMTSNKMPLSEIRMPRLTTEQRLRALGMLESGSSQDTVARYFGVRQSTISRLWNRFNLHGSVNDEPRSGRPRITTRSQDRYIRIQHLRDRFRTASLTAAATVGLHNRPVSRWTIRRRLHEGGLQARRPFRAPTLSHENRQNRLRWARARQRWSFQRWGKILFSDESRFCVSVSDGRERVWRRRGERYHRNCIREFNRYGGPSVMVWGGISWNYRTDLVVVDGTLTSQRYVDEILHPHVIPFMQRHPEMLCFQQDNARPHAARLTRGYLDDNDIQVLPWPPYSPDLSPIEHLWDILGRRVLARHPHTRNDLVRILQEEWHAVPQQTIKNLIRSMRGRCAACIEASGGHTRY